MHKPVETPLATPTLELLAMRRALTAYEITLGAFDLTVSDWLLFELLLRRPEGVRMTESADIVGVALPLITRRVKLHASSGLIVVTAEPDRRAKLLQLTRRGQTLAAVIAAELERVHVLMLGTVSERQAQSYRRRLQHILHRTSS